MTKYIEIHQPDGKHIIDLDTITSGTFGLTSENIANLKKETETDIDRIWKEIASIKAKTDKLP